MVDPSSFVVMFLSGYVNMIAYTTDLDGRASDIVEDSRKIRMKFCEHIAF